MIRSKNPSAHLFFSDPSKKCFIEFDSHFEPQPKTMAFMPVLKRTFELEADRGLGLDKSPLRISFFSEKWFQLSNLFLGDPSSIIPESRFIFRLNTSLVQCVRVPWQTFTKRLVRRGRLQNCIRELIICPEFIRRSSWVVTFRLFSSIFYIICPYF